MVELNSFEELEDLIVSRVNRLISSSVENTFRAVQEVVMREHADFFRFLALSGKLFGSNEGPNFGGGQWSTNFKPLDPLYESRKQVKMNKSGFFRYSGSLEKYFTNQASPFSIFGTPKIVWVRPASGGSIEYTSTSRSQFRKVALDSTNRVTKPKGLKAMPKNFGALAIDIFPKVPNKIERGLRMTEFFTGSRKDKFGYSLDNYQGGQDREFMPQYMLWWIDRRIRRNVLKVIT